MDGLTIVSHPLVQHKLTLLRDRNSSIQLFRAVVREMATLLCYEVTRDLPLETVRIETPIAATDAPLLAGKKLVIAPILRAGLQMAEGMLDLVPSARFAHVGLYRDPMTLQAVEYYFKTPEDCQASLASLVEKAIKAYDARAPGLRHGIALDNQVTIILSQPPEDSTLEKPLCGIYFNLASPYHKKRAPQPVKVAK